jgi:hypothetical protein
LDLQESDVLVSIGRIYHYVKTVLFKRNSNLSPMLVELVDAEILFEGGDDVVLDHEGPAPIELP